MFNTKTQSQYIEVLLESALNIQNGENLIILANVEHKDFVQKCEIRAKELGATKIKTFYDDPHAEFESFSSGKNNYIWLSDEDLSYIDDAIRNKNARLLYLRSNMYNFFDKLPKEKFQLRQIAFWNTFEKIFIYVAQGIVAYTLACLPNQTWAETLFPDLTPADALNKLCEKMMIAVYLDKPNPAKYWSERAETLLNRKKIMERKKFSAVRFVGDGTDLVLDLPELQAWEGGYSPAPDGRLYIPNLPTEEAFSTPIRTGVNGKMHVRFPKRVNGKILDQYIMNFESGRCVSFINEENQELANELYTLWTGRTENADYLGEIALVSSDSGVAVSDTIFLDAVLDENMACHFAFGNTYKFSIEGGRNMTDEEFIAAGGNISVQHSDMPFDSKNMMIYGINKDGSSELILEHGVWVLE